MPTSATDKRFLRRFRAHLQFYEACLFPELFERVNKSALLVAYHIQKREALPTRERLRVAAVLEILSAHARTSVAEDISFETLARALRAYRNAFRDDVGELLTPRRRKKSTRAFRHPIHTFTEWQQQLYGFTPAPEDVILHEAMTVKRRLSTHPPERLYPDTHRFLAQTTSYFQSLIDVDLTDVAMLQRPSYLAPLIPIAAAYTLDRFRPHPRRLVFIDFRARLAPSRLLLLLFHELFGHALHVKLVDARCGDITKRVPYLSRFPLTEGFALLAEDSITALLRRARVHRDLQRLLGPAFSADTTARALRQQYLRLRLLRYARYMFDARTYHDGEDPRRVAHDLARLLGLPARDLWNDLRSFLPTPGYASCYIGGYRILRRLGEYGDPLFRNALGRAGFPFIGDLER